MRLFKPFLWVFLLFLMLLGVLPVAQAQVSDAEHEKRVAASMALLAHGSEDEQGAAIYQLAQMALPPSQGVPLFQAHLQIRTGTLAEALVVAHALEGLAQYGPTARKVLPDLIRLLDQVGTVTGEATYGGQMWGWLLTDFSKIGTDDPNAVEALKRTLRRCLNSPDRLNTLAAETARALGNMGRPAHTAAPLLTLALGRIPSAVPSLAVALSHMMPEARVALPTLIRTLEAGQSPEAIVEAFGTMGPAAKSALPVLHRTLALPSPLLACRAFAAIARVEGQPKLTVSRSLTILQQIDKSSLPSLYAALAAIKLQGTKAEEAAPILAGIVSRRKEPWLRRTAVETLAAVGPARNREAALVLIQAAARQDPVIALEVPKAFEEFGTVAEQVAPELSAQLRSTDSQLREYILRMLYPLGPKASSAVPNLIWLLQQGRRDGKFGGNASEILWLLSKVGPKAEEAVPALTDLLLAQDRGPNASPTFSRGSLLSTLMQIGLTPRVLPAVREMLQSDYPTEVACSAHAVGMLGPQATDTVPLLMRPLRPEYKDSVMTSGFFYGYSYDTSARIESMRALARLGPAAKEALPLLRTYAESPDTEPQRPRFGPPGLKGEALRAIQTIQQAKENQ